MSSRKALIALLAVAFSFGAMAGETPDEFAKLKPTEQFIRLGELIAIESARLQELEMRLKVAKAQAELDRLNAPPPSLISTEEMPTVRGIEGVGTKLTALMGLRGGATQLVSVGERFSGWTVTKIDANGVTVEKGRTATRLPFGGEPPAIGGGVSNSTGFGGGAPNLPAPGGVSTVGR